VTRQTFLLQGWRGADLGFKKFGAKHFPPPATMATSAPPIEEMASSTLSSALATAVLNRAEAEIGQQIDIPISHLVVSVI
jgi:hypothetical protein